MNQNQQNPGSHILDTDYEVLGYTEKLTYSEMYRVLYYSLASLHRQSLRFEAIEMFNDCIGDFKPLFDEIFIKDYQKINEEYENGVDRYRLHRATLISLLQRAGIIELPDMRYDTLPNWVPPKNLEELEQKSEHGLNNDIEN